MARADLHNAFAVDREIYEAALVDPALMDPVVRIDGGVPGTARPFLVVRKYQGPQGYYLEHFTVADPDGRVIARSELRRIELEGEMFEDRFSTLIENVHITSVGEHTLTFYVDDDEVGSVPLFVETADGGDPRIVAEETLKQALKKSSILWVTVPAKPNGAANGRGNGRRGRRVITAHTQPAWFIYDQEKVYVFSGPTEQNIPGLGDAETVELSARAKDPRSLVSRVIADVEVIGTDDERFEKIGRAGLSKRLNLTDGDGALDRWKQNCILVELTPRFRRPDEEAAAAAAPAAAAQPAAAAGAGAAASSTARRPEDEIHVEAEVDQEVFDRLVNEGLPERVARAKAKAAFVRAEKKRLLAEREAAPAG